MQQLEEREHEPRNAKDARVGGGDSGLTTLAKKVGKLKVRNVHAAAAQADEKQRESVKIGAKRLAQCKDDGTEGNEAVEGSCGEFSDVLLWGGGGGGESGRERGRDREREREKERGQNVLTVHLTLRTREGREDPLLRP